MTKVGSIHYELELKKGKFDGSVKSVGSKMSQMGSKIQSSFKAAERGSKILLASVVAVGAGMVVFAKKSVDAYNIQARAEAKLIQLHKENTGATDKQVESLMRQASELQKLGVIGDEAIINGQAQLSTFKLSTKAIKSLTPAMADMVAQQKGVNATGDDFVNIGNLIGKVMEGNIGALGRYGVSFDESSEKILKNGTETERAAELAKVLENNFGGVNEALRQTPEGKIQAIKNNIGDLQEKVGEFVINALDPVITAMGEWVEKIDEAGGIIAWLGDILKRNEKPLYMVAGAIMFGIVPALVAMAAGVWAVMAPLLPFLAIGAALGLLAFVIKENWDKLKPTWDRVAETAKTVWEAMQILWEMAKPLRDFIAGQFKKAWEDIKKAFDQVKEAIKPHLPQLEMLAMIIAGLVIGVIVAFIAIIVAVITVIARVIGWVARLIGWFAEMDVKIRAAISDAWNAVRNGLSQMVAAFRNMLGRIGVVMSILPSLLRRRGVAMIRGLINGIVAMGGALTRGISGVSARIGQFFSGVGSWLFDSGKALIRGLINGITSMGGAVKDAVRGVMDGARNMMPFSPAKEGPFSGKGWTLYSGQSIMEGLADGIKDASLLPKNAMTSAMQSTKEPMNIGTQQLSQNSSTSIFGNVNIGSQQDADYFFDRMNRNQQALGLGLAGGMQ